MEKSIRFFCACVCFFQSGETPDSSAGVVFSALFIIFIFKEICEKNTEKQCETEIPQNNEKMFQLEAKMEQNSGEINKNITKYRQICPKN